MFRFFLFMPSPSSYGRKREGHQYSKFEWLDTVNEKVLPFPAKFTLLKYSPEQRLVVL